MGMPYKCHRCGIALCDNCRLPENHACHTHTQTTQKPFKPVQRYQNKPINHLQNFFNLIKDVVSAIIIIIISGFVVLLIILVWNPSVMDTHNPISDTIKSTLNFPTETTVEKSKESLSYINTIRAGYGKSALNFDIRLYNLAKARGSDLDTYNYFDHTNPVTKTCAWSIKSQYGLKSNEYAAENLYGSEISINKNPQQHQSYHEGIEKDAVDSWLTSRGHRYNLLYSDHISGAIYCSPNSNCVFLGLNHDNFGEGCHTGTEGFAFWENIGTQTGEV